MREDRMDMSKNDRGPKSFSSNDLINHNDNGIDDDLFLITELMNYCDNGEARLRWKYDREFRRF